MTAGAPREPCVNSLYCAGFFVDNQFGSTVQLFFVDQQFEALIRGEMLINYYSQSDEHNIAQETDKRINDL